MFENACVDTEHMHTRCTPPHTHSMLLCQHPDRCALLLKELEAHGLVVTANNPNPRTMVYDDLPHLPYLQVCIFVWGMGWVSCLHHVHAMPTSCPRHAHVMPTSCPRHAHHDQAALCLIMTHVMVFDQVHHHHIVTNPTCKPPNETHPIITGSRQGNTASVPGHPCPGTCTATGIQPPGAWWTHHPCTYWRGSVSLLYASPLL